MLRFDYRQLQCPQPVVETRKQLLAHPGQGLSVQVASQSACDNIGQLAASLSYAVATAASDDGFTLTLTPGTTPDREETPTTAVSGKTIIYCNSERLGDGDEQLSRILLQNFFITLTELDQLPDLLLLVNSGVKLVCSGSEALAPLRQLAGRGVDIAACGLCLDFYQLREQLQVGRVTNMLEIAESQLNAGRIIRP